MCGVFGFLNKDAINQAQAEALAKALAKASEVRGTDASGYAIIDENQIYLKKEIVPGGQLEIQLKESKILLGHTRFATMGDKRSVSQAHPFLSQDKKLALAHNGVGTDDFNKLQSLLKLDGETDSQGILSFIEKVGHQDSGLKKLFETWNETSIALTLLDLEKKSLILARNPHRPLSFSLPLPGLFVYASTKEILEIALGQMNLNNDKIQSLKRFVRLEVSLAGKIDFSKII